MRGLPILDPRAAPDVLLSLAGQESGAASNLSFLAYLDVWLIGGLGLLAVAAVAAKWLWRRWRQGNAGDNDDADSDYCGGADGHYYDDADGR